MKVLVADDVAEVGLQQLRELPGVHVEVQTGMSEDELCRAIVDADALIVRSQTKVTARVLEAAAQLKVVGRAGVGVDNIDVDAATRRGVVVINAPDGNTISACEHTFAMLMSMARRIPDAHQSMREGRWDRKAYVGVEVSGKTLAIVGLGRIGREVAKRAQAFNMNVVCYDPFLSRERAQELGITSLSLDDALAQADFLTIHTPLTRDTRHLLSAEQFAKMKPGVRIVHCARGGVIDEQALIQALREGKVAAAALDVFEAEPLPADHPLRQMENVVLTPHLGASTVEAQVNVAISVAAEIADILRGLPAKNAVNLPALSVEQEAHLRPYLTLGEKLGELAGQLYTGALSHLEITYGGELGDVAVDFVGRTLLKGLLSSRYGDEVNYVNARFLAEMDGLSLREVRQTKSKVFTNLLSVAVTVDGIRHSVAGTIYNGLGPRLVEIDGYPLDAEPQPRMLFTRHVDQPGMIGRIGTLLGEADINIASMQVGRRESGGEAVMLLAVDKVVPDAVIGEISRIPGIQQVSTISL
ncbi:MAG: phosphoglycerate dehydrogenase [Alicyclobacillus herbarius]|uniref:phosphoglycerate dehydrogenase n=1 Tax=Alicyclobacillus herbarius TaxID=122960 RepID=UPI00235710C2|nr:phosphoglycerate dehydrogenase [Alicyclobacillus herbarius]MCL6632690.1 phosphoglycerate dehydrogenase [Alicyclobacillus herbarius]